MNWTKINEICNVVATATTLLPLYFITKKLRGSLADTILFCYLLFSFILDSLTFYIYKVLDQNSYWLTPFYFINNFIILSCFFQKSSNDTFIEKRLPIFIVIGSLFLIIRILFFKAAIRYDEISWFAIQVYFIIMSLYIIRNQAFTIKRQLSQNSIFLISLGVFIYSFFPLFSGLIQSKLYATSPDYFQISLIILNISNILSYILMARGIYFLTPTAFLKPSQQPRERN
jgi:hypothetical protein